MRCIMSGRLLISAMVSLPWVSIKDTAINICRVISGLYSGRRQTSNTERTRCMLSPTAPPTTSKSVEWLQTQTSIQHWKYQDVVPHCTTYDIQNLQCVIRHTLGLQTGSITERTKCMLSPTAPSTTSTSAEWLQANTRAADRPPTLGRPGVCSLLLHHLQH